MQNIPQQETILDLPRYIKIARETAILGNYEQSIDIYSKCLKIIQSRGCEVNDQFLIDKWKVTVASIKSEMAHINNLLELCNVFLTDQKEINKKCAKDNEMSNQILMRDYKPPKRISTKPPVYSQNENYNNDNDIEMHRAQSENAHCDNRWQHFGGKAPFSYINDKDSDDNLNNYDNNIDNRKPNVSKDMDVWDPPIKKHPSFKGNKPVAIHKKPQMDMEKKRNYDKPWKVPEEKKVKEKESNKSRFLLHCYPEDDGVGPDSDLIEMVEKDVVEINPNVKFDDIAELDDAKKILQEAVLLPLLMPDFFKGIRRPWKGVLLYGPPGTGKTLLAKALATQGKTTFFNVSATTFASKWRGESEKLVRILFEMARFYAPSTIFIDEVDSIGGQRKDGEDDANRRVKSEILIQMDGLSSVSSSGANDELSAENNKIVMVLAATNHPWQLDEALRRRFEKRIYIPLPNETGRLEMFKINFKGTTVDSKINWKKFVKTTEGYSGSDIANVCRDAALMQLRRKLTGEFDIFSVVKDPNFKDELNAPITEADIIEAIKNISKSVSHNDLKKYETWTSEFKSK